MHEKWSKIDFFANFRKLQKKLPIGKKRYAEILRTGGAIVRNVEKKYNQSSEKNQVPSLVSQAVVLVSNKKRFVRHCVTMD